MKQLKTILASASVLLLCACSQDLPNAPAEGPNDFGNGFYSKISFRFPGSTRAGEGDASDSGTTTPSDPTSTPDEEVGQAYENKIGSILVVMASKENDEYKFISFALNDAPLTNAKNNQYTITFQDKEQLYEYAGNTVYIFAYCNPTPELRAKIAGTYKASERKYTGGLAVGATFTEEIFIANENSLVESTWKQNGFLMTSAKIKSIDLPEKDVLKTYNSSSNPYPLGIIEVMRTMSRFDFRDAAKDKNENNASLTYTVTNPETNVEQGTVKFTRVALFNIANSFYYLPRLRETGKIAHTLCPGNMELGEVISPTRGYTSPLPPTFDLSAKNVDKDKLDKLTWTSLESVLKNDEDKEEAGDPWNGKGYRIWTYATENTFLNEEFNPGEEGPKFDPTNKVTGYVFEAEINAKGKDPKDRETMYLFGETLYKSAKDIYNAIQNLPVSTLSSAFEAAFTTTGSGESLTITPKDDDAVKNAGFTAYKANADGKFLCYYFAYNKHNDNGDPSKTGVMEFGTVRNNVYKLAITDVKKFGTFEPSSNVEDWDTFFTLDVKVRPWTVRMNNLEF